MVNEVMMVITIIIQLFNGQQIPIEIEKITDMDTCQEEIKDFDPVRMNMMGNVMSVTADCIVLTDEQKDGIIILEHEEGVDI